MFSAAIFDMDGLLLDSERIIMRAWQSAAAEAGITISDADFVSVIGHAAPQAEVILARLLGSAAMVRQIHAAVSPRLTTFPVKDGVITLLAELTARGIPCAVASSTTIKEVRRRLETVELTDYFVTMAGGDEVPTGKPDPAVYLLAAQRLGVDPAQCLAFEDSHHGIRAALAAGMHVIAVPDMVTPDTSACLLQLESLTHALEHVEIWFSPTNMNVIA